MNYSEIVFDTKAKLQNCLTHLLDDLKFHNEEMSDILSAKEVEIRSEEDRKFLEDLEKEAVNDAKETLALTRKLISLYEKF